MFDPSCPFPVYDSDYWWSDGWDATTYGRDFDFSRPFFPQFLELRDTVPHIPLATIRLSLENSDYCNHVTSLKNCFLVFDSHTSESCLYGKGVNRCFDCVDCLKVYDCEACYEVSHSYNCSFCTYLWDSQNCDECHFGRNLIGCSYCFGCTNLRHKKYYFLNQKCSPEEWKEKVEDMYKNHSREDLLKHFQSFQLQSPIKYAESRNVENCEGDFLIHCKNCHECFDCEHCEDCRYCSDLKKGGEVNFGNGDISYFGASVQNSYECTSLGNASHSVLFSNMAWGVHDVWYSWLCVNGAHDLFGCVGLSNQKYCIFNKPYSKDEYFDLRDKIIEHMKETGEWGEFFPAELSPFPYNESLAHEHFPLTKEEVLRREWRWREDDVSDFQPQKVIVPENIQDADESLCQEILACQETGRNFKLQKSELSFYKKMNLPIPRFCPDVRHRRRLARHPGRFLHQKSCAECGTEIQTTHGADGHENVLCEKCYGSVVQ